MVEEKLVWCSMEYFVHLAILVCIYVILAQSFNIAFGLARLFNLAHVAFYAIGAYTTALLTTNYSWSVWTVIPVSMLLPAVLALLVSGISLKLLDDYFAIGTLAFMSIVGALLVNWKSLTRGVLGIPGIPRPEIGSFDLYSNTQFLFLSLLLVLVSQGVIYLLFKNGFSRRLRAQSEYPSAAFALGIDCTATKTTATVLSALFAGLAGSMFAYYLNYIDPSSFALHEMVFVVSIVIVGRPGSFWGVLAATAFLVLLPEPLRFIDLPSSTLGPMRQLLCAVILFGVVYWKKDTIFPHQRSI